MASEDEDDLEVEEKDWKEILKFVATVVVDRQTISSKQKSGPQGPKRDEGYPFCWNYHEGRLTDKEFQLRYRLTKQSFHKLKDILLPFIKTEDEPRGLDQIKERCHVKLD